MARFDDRLDAAIDRLMAEKTLPPEDELRELLAPARALMEAPAPAPAQRTARSRMNAALDARRQRGLIGLFWPGWLGKGQLVSAMVAVAMIAVAALGSLALPDQPLYAIKQGSEAVLTHIPRSPENQARYYVGLADRRLNEMERLVESGRAVSDQELAQFRTDWRKATAVPGVDPAIWQQAALEQARRLQALIPGLPPELRDDAQDLVTMLIRLSGRNAPPPISPPTHTPTPEPTHTHTPEPTHAHAPEPTHAHTPEPTHTPDHGHDKGGHSSDHSG